MDRDEIIRLTRQLDPEQLVILALFLDQLEALPENQTPGTAPDPEAPGDG